MSLRLLTLCLIILLLPAHTAEPVRVFLFAGQSNMEGADADPNLVDQFPPFRGALKTPRKVRYSFQIGSDYKSEGWTNLQAVGDCFGPEISFVRALRRKTQSPLAIIKNAWGGTTLVNDWSPDGGDEKSRKLYQRFITQVQDRLKYLKKRRGSYKIEALIWHQGENDMFHSEGKQLYEKNLRNFIANIRKDLAVPDLKVFIGEISTKGIWGMDNRANVALIRKGQMAVVESDPKVTFVPTSHLSFKVGRNSGLHYHFGTLGQLQHGEAYAAAFLNESVSAKSQLKMPKAKKVKLFVLGGQRNMEGEEAWIAEIQDDSLTKPQAALFQYDLGNSSRSTHWEYLSPINHLGGFGPELSFGKHLIPTMGDGEVLAIYKFTDSGSQSLDWLPQGSDEAYRDRYQAWISGIKKCRDDLIKQGYQCEIPAVFWHCGENDRALAWMAKMYSERFHSFMEATRRDLELPKLPWILTEQPILPENLSSDQKLYDLNTDLEALAAKDPNLYFVKTSDLPHKLVLFGTEGIIALGQRMAESWEKVQK